MSSLLTLIVLICLSAQVNASHNNNWAVVVGTSRYWFNYRHTTNALSIYHAIKKYGIPDSQIILMLPDDMACNPRNKYPAQLFCNRDHEWNVYDRELEVDYRGKDVKVENFLRLLTGRHDPNTPRSKRLLTDENSNILIYMTGHGGAEFLKFNDEEEIGSQDIADAFEQMKQQKRYNEILFMVDTCQAASLDDRFHSPGVLSIGSSLLGENSYSHHNDGDVGLSVADRFTYYSLEFLEKQKDLEKKTIQDLFNTYSYAKLHSNAQYSTENFQRSLNKVQLSDFFSSVSRVKVVSSLYSLERQEAVDAPSHQTTFEEAAAAPQTAGRNANAGPPQPQLRPTVSLTGIELYAVASLLTIAVMGALLVEATSPSIAAAVET